MSINENSFQKYLNHKKTMLMSVENGVKISIKTIQKFYYYLK